MTDCCGAGDHGEDGAEAAAEPPGRGPVPQKGLHQGAGQHMPGMTSSTLHDAQSLNEMAAGPSLDCWTCWPYTRQ